MSFPKLENNIENCQKKPVNNSLLIILLIRCLDFQVVCFSVTFEMQNSHETKLKLMNKKTCITEIM